MRIRHYPIDSQMSRYWKETDSFEVYDNQGNLVVTFSGSELMLMLMKDLQHAGLVHELMQRIGNGNRDLYPRRRLLSQHKPLKTLPTSPHHDR